MFNGVFNGLDKHQLVALVSCLVPVEKSNEQIALKEMLAGPLQDLQETAQTIAEVSPETKAAPQGFSCARSSGSGFTASAAILFCPGCLFPPAQPDAEHL